MVDLPDMLKKLQQMKEDMKKIQGELKDEMVTTGAGKGAVIVTMNGQMDLKALAIDPGLAPMDDAKALSEMIMLAINEAIEKTRSVSAAKIGRLTGGLNIPGLPGM